MRLRKINVKTNFRCICRLLDMREGDAEFFFHLGVSQCCGFYGRVVVISLGEAITRQLAMAKASLAMAKATPSSLKSNELIIVIVHELYCDYNYLIE